MLSVLGQNYFSKTAASNVLILREIICGIDDLIKFKLFKSRAALVSTGTKLQHFFRVRNFLFLQIYCA
jgi:hypothetical protein